MQLAVRSQRIYALDALRAFLMFFGLLVHAGSHTSVVWGMGAIAFVSGLFRMEGFFVLAGFFAAMILTKVPARTFHVRRLQGILVPLLVVLPTNLLAIELHDIYLQQRASLFPGLPVGELQTPWHLHLWFLLVLAGCTVLTLPLVRLADRIQAISRHLPLPPHMICLAIAIGGVLVGRIAITGTLGEYATLDERLYPIVAFGNYLPFYLVGILSYRSEPVRMAMVAPQRADVVVWSAVAAISAAARFGLPLTAGAILTVEAALALAVFGLLCALFQRLVRGPNPSVAFLSDAAYTVYLLHYLVMWLVFAAFAPVFESYWALYALALVLATASMLAFHALVVKRSPVLSFLLNGKRREAASKATAAAPVRAQSAGYG